VNNNREKQFGFASANLYNSLLDFNLYTLLYLYYCLIFILLDSGVKMPYIPKWKWKLCVILQTQGGDFALFSRII